MTDSPETNPAGELEPSTEGAGVASGAWDDLQVGFSGNPKAKLDERGRLKMPAEFKAFIDRKYGKDFSDFYITSREGEDAEIYPMPEWQHQQAKILRMPKGLPLRKKLLESDALYGDRVEMDPQGRLLLPEELRNEGMVNVEVKVKGEGILMRVMSLKSLREKVKSTTYTEQDVDAMTEYDV